MSKPLHSVVLAALVALVAGCGGQSTNAIGHADNVGSGGADAGRSSGDTGGNAAATGGSGSVADSSFSCPDPGSVRACPGKVSNVRVEALTPDGARVFDRGRLFYAIGFDISTSLTFTSTDPRNPDQLDVSVSGNPINGDAISSSAGPGDHEANISLWGCNNLWATKGTLTIVRHDFARHDGGDDATLEGVLRTTEGGWGVDAHFTVSGLCGTINAP